MAKFDFHKRASADRQRRYGSESISDTTIPTEFHSRPKARQSKADARAELERLLAEHTAKEKPRRP
ncbi:hypothetical protein [Brucella grignonensis]|uniref:Uncharacterized protein n=1 Tax=Brucella grignonensis TaxID=94627 RepID=A0A256FEN0_9HYPH|nr:hypothetical protein [Brucella grignonensis]NKB83341.1 hypothetical protein [Brucella grignonensis]OYR13309.1 hypothetical protein CEV33_1034 [Brucella grignonensis]